MVEVINLTAKMIERIADLEDELDRRDDPNVIQAAEPGGPPISAPIGLPEVGDLGFDDMEAAFNMRGWLQHACEVQGAKMTGGGFGGGEADISIELEGHEYWLTIKPIKR